MSEPTIPASVPMVQVERVTKRFGRDAAGVVALDQVDLTVQPGQLVAIHGPSGAGKTTLLNLVAGLDQPDHGTVRTCGIDVADADEHTLLELRRSRIGYVFQTFGLLPSLTAAENIEVPFRLTGTDPAQRTTDVTRLLDTVGLTDRANHRPGELSGGEQQRVAIARALANQPQLLLADEPTSQVDTDTAHSITAWLRALVQRRGMTVLIATHDPDILDTADHVLRLHDGILSSARRDSRPAAS